MKGEVILLSDLQDLLKNKSKYKVNTETGHIGVAQDGEGNQGEYNEKFIFYKHPGLPEGVFMKETHTTDSYGYDFTLQNVEFVKGKEKTITVFEPI
jgi:hypothetical protein